MFFEHFECLLSCRSKSFFSFLLYLAESELLLWSVAELVSGLSPHWSALVLLDLCDRLLKLTDSPALQAAIHQPLNLLQPWEHVEQKQGLLLNDKAC